jgi:hypothetical protein
LCFLACSEINIDLRKHWLPVFDQCVNASLHFLDGLLNQEDTTA